MLWKVYSNFIVLSGPWKEVREVTTKLWRYRRLQGIFDKKIEIYRHCLFVSNRLFWQESSLTRIQQRACLCATLPVLDRVTLISCCTILSEFATVSDLWRSFFKQIKKWNFADKKI